MKALTLVTAIILLVGCNAPTTPEQAAGLSSQTDGGSPEGSGAGGDAPTSGIQTVEPCDSGASPFGAGNGNGGSPFLICSESQLAQIGAYPDAHFALAADIALTQEWVAPGTFHGNFDGQGHAIDNLKVRKNVYCNPANPNTGCGSQLGFWYSLGTNAVVKNLTFTNVDIQGASNVGALAGDAYYLAQVENVHVLSGSVAGSGAGVGALIGLNYAQLPSCTSSIGPMTGN